MKNYNCRAIKQKRKKADFSMTWYETEFPLVYQKWRELVDKQRKSPKNPTRGEFRALLLNFVEEGLRKEFPLLDPMIRIERKLDELLKLIKQGVPIAQASEQIKAESQISGDNLTAEDKARLNAILNEL
jgi:hypothetical protein